MREDHLQQQVIDLARLTGWKVAHFRPAKTERGWRTPVQGDGVGFPDLILIRGQRIIAAELKSDTGRTTLEQDDWLTLFHTAGAETYVWRPRDWDTIERLLKSDLHALQRPHPSVDR